jgi:starch phosphorylase
MSAVPNLTGFEPDEFSLDHDKLRRLIATKLAHSLGKDPAIATLHDWYGAVALALRDGLADRGRRTQARIRETQARKVYYLSLEFLMGRSLANAAINLDAEYDLIALMKEAGITAEDIVGEEPDAGLGNGGLGRLAACFLDSMATMGLAGFGYGIRYDYGLFRQEIDESGQQRELPNRWLRYRNYWEIERQDIRYDIKIGGHVRAYRDEKGKVVQEWTDAQVIEAVAFDTPIPGNDGKTVNYLRLWTARHAPAIDLDRFNQGDYRGAVELKDAAENITQVLYPDDSSQEGKLLRIKQEYFFVSASLQDIIHQHLADGYTLEQIPEKVTIQLNDTHPALAIPEMMRILGDEHGLDWATSWKITCGTFNYTNHTLLPEALETWPVTMLEQIVPRLLEIIYQINRLFLDEVSARYPDDLDRRRRMSIIDEAGYDGRRVRMAWLAAIGSGKVNGVAALHSELIRKTIFSDFDELFPGKFVNVTNGVTPRRWLKAANPRLARLVTERIGRGWENDLPQLEQLLEYIDDPAFRENFAAIKHRNKRRLARMIRERTGVTVNPDSMFDVQIKRIHEYKRQHLNLLHVITRYHRIKANPSADWVPRTVIFAGKAAPAYIAAKWIIQLINNVADVINRDPVVGDRLKVVFVPNYNVSSAEVIIPAADLSEQISTAGMEASGTGNMKLALNGALTIGTLDGANIEIAQEVGSDNIFIFGLTTDEVEEKRRRGYVPREVVEANPELRLVLDDIGRGAFSRDDLRRFSPLLDRLTDDGEWFLVLADYAAYVAAQERVDEAFRDRESWQRKAIINTAKMGKFSSDRSIMEYARTIWNVGPIG